MRIEQLQGEFDLDCHHHPFPLHPETPDAGMSLEELFGGRMDIPAAMARLKEVAGSLDLPFGERSHTYNSRRAQELGLWAEEQGRFDDYLAAVYRAYFVDGVNIARPEVLLEIIDRLGMEVGPAEQALTTGSYAARIDAAWERAMTTGIRAVPTLRCEGRELVGFQDPAAFRKLITG